MLHFVTSYMKQNKSRKQTLESAQYGLEISFKAPTLQYSIGLEFKISEMNPCVMSHELLRLVSQTFCRKKYIEVHVT